MKLLEVCVDSLASARAAKVGGADRLEFCSALAVGGLTPYADLLRQIKAEIDLPVRCLMRPRAGDFLYTKEEIDLLCRQIETLRAAGADGFVIGALTPKGTLDLSAMRALLNACGGAPVTLHRCIDVSRNLAETYRAAAALGIDTVLTSGGAASCRDAVPQLAELLRLRDELYGPEVLIGAGVNAAVIDELRAALPGAVTLHRCIDVSRNLAETYRAAAALGIDTVLTSGGAASCRDAVPQLAELLRLRDELYGPEVLIGAGVNAAVIDELRAALPGARAFHASCKTLLESGMTFRREGVPMGLPGLGEWHIQQTDPDAVRAAKAAVMR